MDVQCHGDWNFSTVRFDDRSGSIDEVSSFFNTGVSDYAPPNRGIYERTRKAEDVGKVQASALRNIAVTAPYMHDGGLATLEAVIDRYGQVAGWIIRIRRRSFAPSN